MVIGIIGGGASGMVAAIAAAQNPGVQVELFERQARVGRKLLATGNGRCNLTNLHAVQGGYHGEDASFVQHALKEMDPEATLKWFRELGLYTVAEESGRVYPYSDQANSVVDVLRLALNRPNIHLHTGFEVQKVRLDNDGFVVENSEESFRCDRLIVACGGLAGTKLGGSMSGYKLLAKLGHKSTRLRPALVQLKCDWSGVTALKGVRTNCHVDICKDGQVFSQSMGELQFTDYGLSGPVIFEVSRDACYGAGQWSARLDFLPDISAESILRELCRRRETQLPVEELLTGILHNRLGRVLTRAAGIRDKNLAAELTDEELQSVANAVKSFEIALTEPLGMDSAQVTAGGVLTRDFDPLTMESKLVPGLYACGEVLDIDGDCGGYNLQWAWSSGYLAGVNAGKEEA
jgi:predicted Rossmann fold flavoprotein